MKKIFEFPLGYGVSLSRGLSPLIGIWLDKDLILLYREGWG
jgi:hypothetical protein